MKRILAIILLTAATMQANDVSESWNNFAKDSRVASGFKSVVVAVLAVQALRSSVKAIQKASEIANNNVEWKNKWDEFSRELVITGGMGYTSFNLGYYFLPNHLRHALAV